jgi:hypothetical protein
MISFFRYLSARSHLKEINKTIEAMGGDEAPPMLQAQRDITSDEVTYFFYETVASIIYSLLFIIILICAYGVYDGI